MPQRFGEEITEEDAYNTAREALDHMNDQSLMELPESIAWSDIHKRAIADELKARGLPPRVWPETTSDLRE
jgi:hypothetical protein